MDLAPAELDAIIARALAAPRNLDVEDLTRLLELRDPELVARLHGAAYRLKCHYCGRKVSIRGIVELGNICAKDCYYCGIRRSNSALERYQLTPDDVERLARVDFEAGYASIVLQGGEIESEANTAYIEECLARIRPLGLGVTLSLGEQEESVYRRWHEAGAVRYLLRIETSSPELYARLHPPSHDWRRRVECLHALRRTGYQVGTGVMCALPGQSLADLARDIVFFGEVDADMIGMGPYIPHPDTPLAHDPEALAHSDSDRLHLGLNLIAATRLHLHDVNIAATTALQALAPDGRERGILAGANVIMPNVSDVAYRRRYQLYANKPSLDENAWECRAALERSLAAIGETINYGQRGDSPHFRADRSVGGPQAREQDEPSNI